MMRRTERFSILLQGWFSSRLLVLGLILLAPLYSIYAESEKPSKELPKPDLAGQVKAGEATPKATIFIFTAGPKVGTSTFCPSCYADCRKSAKSDADGKFKIDSLDPQLLFRILVVAKGYKPKFISKVDPAAGPLTVELEAVESRQITPDKSIQGKVVDPEGKPIVGAVVQAQGIRKKNDIGTMWGTLPGVDPLAVTDEQGEFLLTAQDSFQSMDVRVEARAFAHKGFTKLASGTNRHTLTLGEGATVKGKVMRNGKGVADVSVGMVGCDRGVENFTGNFDVGTDTDGRFMFVNLPPNTDYFIYGLMNTLKTYGAITIQRVHTGDDGATLDAGDLAVEPALRLAGQVVCADGEPIPAKTRLLLGREDAWDTLQIELDKSGRFDATGIPRETISLSARIPEYRISARNPSLDTMNPFHLIGRMDHDITNLIFLLEKGPEFHSEFDSQVPESEWPRNRPLRGAEAAPDHSREYLISGTMLDAQTKQPVSQFRVTPGNAQGPFSRTMWNKRNTAEGTNGSYVLYLDKKYGQPVLKVEAEGYLPQKFTLLAEPSTNLNLTLQKGTGPSGTLLLPDGKPAQGASIMLLCADSSQTGLRADGTLQAYQNREMVHYTDPDGSFTFSPELDMLAVVAATKDGFKMLSVQELATNSNVALESWGRIQGVLRRAEILSTNEDVDLGFQEQKYNIQFNLQYHTMTDSEGRFEFDRVPPGRLQINGRNKISDRGWTWDPLEKITLKPGQDLQVDIHAPARAVSNTPVETRRRTDRGPKLARKSEPGPSGVVLLPDGKPALDAEVALRVKDQNIAVGKGSLHSYEARQEGLIVRAGSGGSFSLPSIDGATGIIAVHDQGYAYIPVSSPTNSLEIKLNAWGEIQGVCRIGRRLGTNEQITLQSANMAADGSPMLAHEDFQTRTDNGGRFVIRFVPPGEYTITRMIPNGAGWQSSVGTSLVVKSGIVTQTSLGGDGQIVIGKVNVKAPGVNYQNVHANLHTPLPEALRKARTPEEHKAAASTPEAKAALKSYRHYGVIMAADGSFRVEEVLPGKYELDLMLTKSAGFPTEPSDIIGRFRREVVVPDTKAKDELLTDLGTVECEPVVTAASDH